MHNLFHIYFRFSSGFVFFVQQMLAKLWHQDQKIKKLASFSTFHELKKKAVEQGVCPSCPNKDVKASKQSYHPDSVQIFFYMSQSHYRYFLKMGPRWKRRRFSACWNLLSDSWAVFL